MLSWRVDREGHGEEQNAIAIIFYFLNFKFYLMKLLFLETRRSSRRKIKKNFGRFEK